MSTENKSLIAAVEKQIGDRKFFTPRDLHALGLFNTIESARYALKTGVLPYVSMSQRRRIVPRAVLLNYIECQIKGYRND